MTATVSVVTAVVSVWGLLDPGWGAHLLRDHVLLWSGQWWRVLTPILVQPDGWGQLGFNLAGTLLVGAALERALQQLRSPTWPWWCVYLLAGVGSNLVLAVLGLGDHDGGSSACVAGLVGALAVVDVRHPLVARGPLAVLGAAYGTFFCAYLLGLSLVGPWAGALAGDLCVVAFLVGRRLAGVVAADLGRLVLVVASAAVLSLRLDDHGFGLLAGVAVTVVALAHATHRDRTASVTGGRS